MHVSMCGWFIAVMALAMVSLVGVTHRHALERSQIRKYAGMHGLETWSQSFRTGEEALGDNATAVSQRLRRYSLKPGVTRLWRAGGILERIEELERKAVAVHDASVQTAANSTLVGRIRRKTTERGMRGSLVCDGKSMDHEIIYWRDIPEDRDYVAPTARGSGKYLTFEYDQGGWNNVRMGVECLVVIAHAMGRILVVPPAQNLYLLGAPVDGKRKKLGFADFFDLDALKAHRGLHILTMSEFLERQLADLPESKRPPKTSLWGADLWWYLKSVADVMPTWNGAIFAMPRSFSGETGGQRDFTKDELRMLQRYAGGRRVAYYDDDNRVARHLHLPASGKHRLLQHHYAFTFFADPIQRSFYRRLIRDTMRYVDPIQCAGAKLVDAVRKTSRDLGFGGKYYALHIRRGDFQYKEVKLSATKIIENLRGNDIIPRGSLVFIATDDPEGKCEKCRSNGKPCPKPVQGAKQADMPKGCPADPSWNAFWQNGWVLLFSRNFTEGHTSNVAGAVDGINPNYLGMAESVVCSRAEIFAGTWFSTFTGYIHRLRGFHGLGEQTYYHSNGRVDAARSSDSYGRSYARESRIGWTDDGETLI